jgi:uncharacterized protein (TIGR02996 family)
MPLFELEDGPTRRFYRIELDGTRVGLNWGRIGYDGTHESLRFETVAEARTEYERQIARRRERGYREVERLEPAVIVESDKKPEPILERDEREIDPSRVAARDRELAELVERGLRLEQLGDEHGARPRVTAPTLRSNAALEAAVAEDPFDGSAWMVLEDWLLEIEDPRAAIVRAEQIGRARKQARRSDITQAYDHLMTQLLGQRHAAIAKALEDAAWRAGYLLSARFNPKSHHGELLAGLLASPAAPLLRSLELCVLGGADLAPMLEQLGRADCAKSLRELAITSLLPISYAGLDGTTLAPLRLQRLAVKGQPLEVSYAPVLAHLRRLELLTDVGFELLGHALTELRTLVLDVRALEKNRWNSDQCAIRLSELESLLAGTSAPQLENLHVANARRPTIEALVAELATSKLLGQLRTLDFGGERVDGSTLGAAFAHLELLRLP